MATLTIMRGLPASGKSTWARKHVADHLRNASQTVACAARATNCSVRSVRRVW